MNKRIEQIFTICLSVLVFLLPIHNLLVQFATNKLNISPLIAAWKDVFIIVILVTLLVEIYLNIIKLQEYEVPKRQILQTLLPIIIVLGLNIWAVITSFSLNQPPNTKAFVFGYYFELWWVDLFAIVVSWWWIVQKRLELKLKLLPDLIESTNIQINAFKLNILKYVVAAFGMVVFVTLISLIFGQERILGLFGYGNQNTVASLVSSNSACHHIDYQIATCRATGTFSHPLGFASYLLLVLPIFLITALRVNSHKLKRIFIALALLCGVLIAMTYSRFALAGLAGFALLFATYYLNRKQFLNLKLCKFILGITLFVITFGGIALLSLDLQQFKDLLPSQLVKPSSTAIHARLINANAEIIRDSGEKSITGFGIGNSGSATREKYQDLKDNPIYTQYGYVAYKWGLLPEPMLLPDNWFLQLILNGGYIYAIVYTLIILIPLIPLFNLFKARKWNQFLLSQAVLAIGFLSIIIGSTLEHLWENQTIVFYWIVLYLFLFSLNKQVDDDLPAGL